MANAHDWPGNAAPPPAGRSTSPTTAAQTGRHPRRRCPSATRFTVRPHSAPPPRQRPMPCSRRSWLPTGSSTLAMSAPSANAGIPPGGVGRQDQPPHCVLTTGRPPAPTSIPLLDLVTGADVLRRPSRRALLHGQQLSPISAESILRCLAESGARLTVGLVEPCEDRHNHRK
jgi:hypothetical protein